MDRFKVMNKENKYHDQINPFNFIIAGTSAENRDHTLKGVKPIIPYTKNPQMAPYGEFIDYHSGNVMRGERYWKKFSDVLLDYFTHQESKFDGSSGKLERKYIEVGRIIPIGKEADKLEETTVLGVDEDGYQIYEDLKDKITKDPRSVSYRLAEKRGVSRTTLKRWRKKLI